MSDSHKFILAADEADPFEGFPVLKEDEDEVLPDVPIPHWVELPEPHGLENPDGAYTVMRRSSGGFPFLPWPEHKGKRENMRGYFGPEQVGIPYNEYVLGLRHGNIFESELGFLVYSEFKAAPTGNAPDWDDLKEHEKKADRKVLFKNAVISADPGLGSPNFLGAIRMLWHGCWRGVPAFPSAQVVFADLVNALNLPDEWWAALSGAKKTDRLSIRGRHLLAHRLMAPSAPPDTGVPLFPFKKKRSQ